MMQAISIVFVLLITVAFGCSSAHPPTAAAEYHTLGNDPHRDTDRARSLNDQAAAAIRHGNYAEGEKLLRAALAADVMFGPAHNNLGKIYFAQKNLYLAAWEFTYAAKLMKHQPEPRNNLGLVFEASGNVFAIAESWHRGPTADPVDDPTEIDAIARKLLADARPNADMQGRDRKG